MNVSDNQANRLYALNLLNRANADFNQHDVALVAAIIALLESDVGDLVDGVASEAGTAGTLAAMKLHRTSSMIAEGRHRPGSACETPSGLSVVPAAQSDPSSTTERTTK